MDAEPARRWKIQDLWPEKGDEEISKLLAEHFNKIGRDFLLLGATQRMYDRRIADLTVEEVSLRLKSYKKPASMVPGDVSDQISRLPGGTFVFHY